MIALISDIHGNIHALDAVLADMPPVDEIWVLGDLVGGFPFNCEVVDKIMNLPNTTTILGNWDEFLLNVYQNRPAEYWQTPRYGTIAYTADTLQPQHVQFLAKLPKTIIKSAKPSVLLYHGTPTDIEGVILSQETAEATIKGYSQTLLIGGHSHKARYFRLNNQKIIGVGSVGLPFDELPGTACYALLDGENLDKTTFRHVAYDLDAALLALKNSELAERSPYFSKSFALTAVTGENYTKGAKGLWTFIDNYAEQHGYSTNNIPNDFWEQAAKLWQPVISPYLAEKIGW
ncbi:MAG: metallophosphatase family protein [Defluviitaleaceae bacterium]|nr:metallophosphatase family protein [Defluviitaleaceae bacterium]